MITLSATIKIDDSNTINIDRNNLISLESPILSRSDISLPSYGIISNSGSVSFIDNYGTIKEYAENLLLKSDLEVKLYINNTTYGNSEPIGVFETQDWNYDSDNREVDVSFKDDLEEWQNISVNEISYDARNYEVQSMQYFYQYLYARTPKKYNMLKFEELDEQTQYHIANCVIRYPFLKKNNLWSQWSKFCQVCGTYIYKNNEGKTVCHYSYGS